tara:strand:- start:45 stop:920 length:876 start_codon:yes stop_codon:yes gene_type:complete
MPKFNKQNKKRIDPRYFLSESIEREDLIEDIREFSKDVAGSRDTYGDIDKLAVMDVAELEEYFRSLTSSGQNTARLAEETWQKFINEESTSGDEIIETSDGKVVIFSQWAKSHIEDGHKDPGKGSVFADFNLGLISSKLQGISLLPSEESTISSPEVDSEVDSSDPSKSVYEIEVSNVGYDLVIPNDEAARLPDARQTEVEKEDRNGPIKVNAYLTSAPLESFMTSTMSIVIRPTDQIKFVPETIASDERIAAAIERGELYSVISSWPGRGNVPPASQWGDDWAVILPNQQ